MTIPRLPLTLAAVTILAVACAADAGDSPDGTQSASPSSVPSTSPTLTPASEQPSPEAPMEGDRLTGSLGADTIEGGCGYLQAGDGTRYEVLYPDGWELTLSPLELRDPDGDVVARGGDTVTVVGEEATDMASICQIGPIFRATGVER